jgi:hypothetical protein
MPLSCGVNKIHATHFWVCMLTTLGGFIECKNRSDFRMGASTLMQLDNQITACHEVV